MSASITVAAVLSRRERRVTLRLRGRWGDRKFGGALVIRPWRVLVAREGEPLSSGSGHLSTAMAQVPIEERRPEIEAILVEADTPPIGWAVRRAEGEDDRLVIVVAPDPMFGTAVSLQLDESRLRALMGRPVDLTFEARLERRGWEGVQVYGWPDGAGHWARIEAKWGMPSEEDVVARLGKHHGLYGVTWRGGVRYPGFQIVEEGEKWRVAPAWLDLRRRLPAGWSDLARVLWTVAPNAWLEGRPPADEVRARPEAVTPELARAAREAAPGDT